eukprot:2596517-Pyramimonas_sp.AAC.1
MRCTCGAVAFSGELFACRGQGRRETEPRHPDIVAAERAMKVAALERIDYEQWVNAPARALGSRHLQARPFVRKVERLAQAGRAGASVPDTFFVEQQ